MEAAYFTENEKRLRTVEEAIIKMEQILEVVLVDLKDRVRVLEKHDAEVQKQMHESCDLKSDEIDRKCADVKKSLSDYISDSRSLFFKIVGSSIGIGIIYIIYSTQHISALEANQKVLIEKIEQLGDSIEQLNNKLDKATAQRYHIRDDIKGVS